MHGISPHQLAFWIAVFAGSAVSIALSLGVAFAAALQEPEEPERRGFQRGPLRAD